MYVCVVTIFIFNKVIMKVCTHTLAGLGSQVSTAIILWVKHQKVWEPLIYIINQDMMNNILQVYDQVMLLDLDNNLTDGNMNKINGRGSKMNP